MIWLLVIGTNIITYYIADMYGGRRLIKQVLCAGLMPALQAYLSRALIELEIKMKVAPWYEEENALHHAISKKFVDSKQVTKVVKDE